MRKCLTEGNIAPNSTPTQEQFLRVGMRAKSARNCSVSLTDFAACAFGKPRLRCPGSPPDVGIACPVIPAVVVECTEPYAVEFGLLMLRAGFGIGRQD